jgi:hypothetical protein
MNNTQQDFLENSSSDEVLEMVDCISKAEENGRLIEVVYTALKDMRDNPQSSLLLPLHIALKDWNI